MKWLIILGLLVALLLALFITRPSQQSFVDFYAQQSASKDHSLVTQALDTTGAKLWAQTFTYSDHYLWVNMESNGKVAFTGALGHWFMRDASAAKPLGS